MLRKNLQTSKPIESSTHRTLPQYEAQQIRDAFPPPIFHRTKSGKNRDNTHHPLIYGLNQFVRPLSFIRAK